MDPIAVIKEFYNEDSRAFRVLVDHGSQVARLAVAAAKAMGLPPERQQFVSEASLLHDIGIIRVNAPGLGCFGEAPYLCHGYLGREMLDSLSLPEHALVCERHVGVGISAGDVEEFGLPLPRRDMVPETIEEEIITWADKFFSKDGSGAREPKSPAAVVEMLEAFKPGLSKKFKVWQKRFGAVLY